VCCQPAESLLPNFLEMLPLWICAAVTAYFYPSCCISVCCHGWLCYVRMTLLPWCGIDLVDTTLHCFGVVLVCLGITRALNLFHHSPCLSGLGHIWVFFCTWALNISYTISLISNDEVLTPGEDS
jgi:hypothetical protein